MSEFDHFGADHPSPADSDDLEGVSDEHGDPAGLEAAAPPAPPAASSGPGAPEGDISGEISVTIALASGTTYTLEGSVPTSDTDPYGFTLTETDDGTQTVLADFSYTDSDTFNVEVNFPKISTGTATITGGFKIASTAPPAAAE